MRKPRSTRKRKEALWQIIFLIGSCLIFFLILLFLGLPLLAKLSLFLGKLKGEEEAVLLVDQTPPFPPQPEVPFTATNSAKITLQGISEPGSTVRLSLNDRELEKVLVGKDGTFSKRVTLKEGENKILAQAIDQAGNESGPSIPLLIFFKKEAPRLEIEFPPETDYQSEEEEIEIKGKTDPEVNLAINDRFVLVKSDGSFSFTVALSEGENLIEIVAIDQAGNQTKVERKVTFSR